MSAPTALSKKVYFLKFKVREYWFYVRTGHPVLRKIPSIVLESIALYSRFALYRMREMIFGTGKFSPYKKSYSIMMQDMKKAGYAYKSSLMWKNIHANFLKQMYVHGLTNFKSGRINGRFVSFAKDDPIFFKWYMNLLWNVIRKFDELKLLEKIEEPTLGGGLFLMINKRRFTPDLLYSIYEFYSIYIYKDLRKKHTIVVDLGAGYGRNAYVFLKACPSITYVVIDLPGSLIISQSYLSELFKNEKILRYEESRKIENLTESVMKKYKLIFLAPWDLEKIEKKSVDIFINIFSFMEMRKDAVDQYFSLIDKLTRGVFYSKQLYRHDNHFDAVKINLEDYPYNRKWKKIYVRNSITNPDAFETLYGV